MNPDIATTDLHCKRAQSNLLSAIDSRLRFPRNVFGASWASFYLFNSDWIFEGTFLGKVRMLLNKKGACCACITNLDREVGNASATFAIDSSTASQDYQQRLAGTGPDDGWVYFMDRFACSSDIGTWCIYCERASELAIIAFCGESMQGRHEDVLAAFHASGVESIGREPSRFEFSPYVVSTAWQEEITKNYRSKG